MNKRPANRESKAISISISVSILSLLLLPQAAAQSTFDARVLEVPTDFGPILIVEPIV